MGALPTFLKRLLFATWRPSRKACSLRQRNGGNTFAGQSVYSGKQSAEKLRRQPARKLRARPKIIGAFMVDVVDAATRSRMMSGIRSRHTKPERIIRSGLHRLGFRFALHSRKLSGTPDLVLPRYRAAIFVHGCFWHRHNCEFFKMPSTRTGFWKAKFARNRSNDIAARKELANEGWRVLVVWECALRDRSESEVTAILLRAASWIKGHRKSLELSGPRRKAV